MCLSLLWILREGTFLHWGKCNRIYITGGSLNHEMKIILEISPRTLLRNTFSSLFQLLQVLLGGYAKDPRI